MSRRNKKGARRELSAGGTSLFDLYCIPLQSQSGQPKRAGRSAFFVRLVLQCALLSFHTSRQLPPMNSRRMELLGMLTLSAPMK